MDNYVLAQRAAEKRFCTYDPELILRKPGVTLENNDICTTFLGEAVRVDMDSGKVWIAGRYADFCESLTIFDWLCDRRENARASWEFCPVSSLPGILLSGGTLVMNFERIAEQIGKDPARLISACESMGGVPTGAGDLGYQILAFPDLPMQLKFYFADEEFPASLTLLWDKNTLHFIRYETVYYLAGCVRKRLEPFDR